MISSLSGKPGGKALCHVCRGRFEEEFMISQPLFSSRACVYHLKKKQKPNFHAAVYPEPSSGLGAGCGAGWAAGAGCRWCGAGAPRAAGLCRQEEP